MSSRMTGNRDARTIRRIIGSTYLSALGIRDPRKYPRSGRRSAQRKLPMTLYKRNFLYCIDATPARMGTNVLAAGMNLAMMMLRDPKRSKKDFACSTR